MHNKNLFRAFACLLFVACGNDEMAPEPKPVKTYSISVEVNAISAPMVLKMNGRFEKTITEGGTYTFSKELESGQHYYVTFHTDVDSCRIQDEAAEGDVTNKNVTVILHCK